MKKNYCIDDVRLPERQPKWGWPILFTNQDIRKMLKLAQLTKKDIFFDLGCGWGQNLKIALTEFGVKKAIGIEDDKKRYEIARKRLTKIASRERWEIVKGKFEDLFSDKIEDVNLGDATVVFYGLDPSKYVLRGLQKKLHRGCRLITYFECVYPEIKYDRRDFPFYLAQFPFKKPKSEADWLRSIIGKTVSKYELWEEFCHDFDIVFLRNQIHRYKKRLDLI